MHPQAESAPQADSKSQFFGHFCWMGEIWSVGVVCLVVLACVLRATTKKGLGKPFLRKKCTPEKILATPMHNSTVDHVSSGARITEVH